MAASPRRRRVVVLIYLLAIAGPTVVLLVLGLQSVARQREAIAGLAVSNLRLSADRLAAELERRARALADACLHDPGLTRLGLVEGRTGTPEETRRLRAKLAAVGARHPIAEQFFVVRGDEVLFPPLQAPLPKGVEASRSENPEASRRFADLWSQAESEEFQAERPDRALGIYRQAHELPVSAPLKALALARVARCLAKLRDLEAAERTYRSLAERYGDLYDDFQRPYGIVAALERQDLLARIGSKTDVLLPVYRALRDGHWELDGDQLEYFVDRIHERLPARPNSPETPFVRQFQLARALDGSIRDQGRLQIGQIYSAPLAHDDVHYQTYYSVTDRAGALSTIIGFAVDLRWVEQYLLPLSHRELLLPLVPAFAVRMRQTSGSGADRPNVAGSFRALFPFWELVETPSRDARPVNGGRTGLIFTATTLLVLSVLLAGALLLVRDLSREAQLNQLKSDFVNAVSHDLKTPLTVIRLYGETLAYGRDRPEPERRRFGEIITTEAERLSRLIEKVLDFSQIGRRARQYDLEEGDLAPVIARTVAPYREYLERRGFAVDTDLADRLAPVEFDASAVSKAVLNLLENAVKYSGDSKVIAVRLRPEPEHAVFEVEDRGVGMSPGEQERAFEQFYRGSSARGHGGSGLGLFLVKHVMDAHHGQIVVVSEPGRGTLVRLLFPFSPGVTDAAPTEVAGDDASSPS
jgi:signal transduction histidine kinase